MNVSTKWNLGNFTIALGAEVNDEQYAILATRGLLHSGQRVSKIDKVLGGFEKKGDKEVRRKDWKRTDADYSDALRDKLQALFESLEIADDVKIPCDVSIVQYDGAQSAEPKYAREKKKFAEKESTPAGLDAWLKSFVKYDGPSHGEDGEYAVEALSAAKAAIDKFLAENI